MIGPVATILSLAANTLTDKTACDNLLDKNVSAPGTLSRDANVAIGFTITANEAPFTFSTQRERAGYTVVHRPYVKPSCVIL
jgi:hypothetical protein